MMATTAVMAAIAEKKSSAIIWKPLSSDKSETIAEIELSVSQRLLSLRSLESGFISGA